MVYEPLDRGDATELTSEEEVLMHQRIEVVFENGVLRPLRPLPEALHEFQAMLDAKGIIDVENGDRHAADWRLADQHMGGSDAGFYL
jgi:hypothetical protein